MRKIPIALLICTASLGLSGVASAKSPTLSITSARLASAKFLQHRGCTAVNPLKGPVRYFDFERGCARAGFVANGSQALQGQITCRRLSRASVECAWVWFDGSGSGANATLTTADNSSGRTRVHRSDEWGWGYEHFTAPSESCDGDDCGNPSDWPWWTKTSSMLPYWG